MPGPYLGGDRPAFLKEAKKYRRWGRVVQAGSRRGETITELM